MAVHVFSQKIKKLLYDCDLFQYYAGYIFGHVLRCFRRKRNMFLSNDNGYMHIYIALSRSLRYVFHLLSFKYVYTESSHDFPLVSGYFDSAYYILWFWYVCVTQTRCFLCLKEIHKTNFVSD